MLPRQAPTRSCYKPQELSDVLIKTGKSHRRAVQGMIAIPKRDVEPITVTERPVPHSPIRNRSRWHSLAKSQPKLLQTLEVGSANGNRIRWVPCPATSDCASPFLFNPSCFAHSRLFQAMDQFCDIAVTSASRFDLKKACTERYRPT